MYKTASRLAQHRASNPRKPKTAQPHAKGRKKRYHKLSNVLRSAFSSNRIITGLITSFNKGGFEVLSNGSRAFCPFSLMYPPVIVDSDKRNLVGQKLEFVVHRITPSVVLSRRTVVRKCTLEKLKQAHRRREIVVGRITNIMPYGAFVDLGAIDGLLHISEISDGWVDSIKDILRPGLVVQVRVLNFEHKDKISLSMRQLP